MMQYGYLQNPSLDTEDANHQVVPGAWREAGMMRSLEKIKGKDRATTLVLRQREYLKKYFNSPAGSVSWQDNML